MGKFLNERKPVAKTLMPGDPNWFFTTDGFSLTPRASFSINQQCPKEYRDILAICINNGWIKPVAHVKESEFIWEQLGG